MDEGFHCNVLRCRRRLDLDGKAVVTTCSHIFCLDCAQNLFTSARVCPACDASLLEPDDVVVSSLNPTADYRASVLAGLSPAVVMDICTRAMSFHQYQVYQEAAYQAMILRNMQERNELLDKRMQSVINEANSEVAHLTERLRRMDTDLQNEKRKNRELSDSLRTAGKDYARLKNQHDAYQRQSLRPGAGQATKLQNAAAAASASQARVAARPSQTPTPLYPRSDDTGGPVKQNLAPFWQNQAVGGASGSEGSPASDGRSAAKPGPSQHPRINHGRFDGRAFGQQVVVPPPSTPKARPSEAAPVRPSRPNGHASPGIRAMPLPTPRRQNRAGVAGGRGSDAGTFRFSTAS